MENVDDGPNAPARLNILAIGEWLMVLPAMLFLATAALRQLQPRRYEPAHTSRIIFKWFAHMPSLLVAALLIGLPAVAFTVGIATVLRAWSKDQALRFDTTAAFAIGRRHLPAYLLATATMLAGIILAAVAAHMVAG